MKLRAIALIVHRYVGLAMAGFLIIAGVTGSVIAFNHQLDALVNPALYHVQPPTPGSALLDPFELDAKLHAQFPPDQDLGYVPLHLEPGATVPYWLGEGRQIFVDPYTAKIVGQRTWGELSEGFVNLIPFLFKLHFTLALGEVGGLIFGIVALLWTIDCFVGAYLTFPPASKGTTRASPLVWLRRWVPAWQLKTNKLFAFVFTWHRASGLWVWLMFFIFAWSATALLLRDVYEPVMNAVVFWEPKHVEFEPPELAEPRRHPKIAPREAHELGKRMMAAEAQRRGFRVIREQALGVYPETGTYAYSVESTLDVAEEFPETTVTFDSDDGRFLSFSAWTGQSSAGTITSWLVALHFGAVREGGLPYRIFVSVMGLVVTLLSVSGVWIWWKKRKKTAPVAARAAARASAAPPGATSAS